MSTRSVRHSVRVESPPVKPEVGGPVTADTCNDSRGLPQHGNGTPQRLRRHTLEAIRRRLSPLDLTIVETLHGFRWATTGQMERLFLTTGTPASRGRRMRATLKRLTDLRVVARLPRVIGGTRAGSSGHLYTLDIAGQYIARRGTDANRQRRIWTPSQAFVDHTLAITELYVRLTQAHRAGTLELASFEPEPACWRDFTADVGRVTFKPDGFVRIGHGEFEDLWFIEVDRGTESGSALMRKNRVIRQYWTSENEQRRWGVFPRVLWLVPDRKRLGQMIDVVGAQPPESWPIFAVRLFDEAIDLLSKGVPS